MSVQECWVIAKEKRLCFNVLQMIIWERIVQGQRYAQYRDAKEAITIYYMGTLKKRSGVATGGGQLAELYFKGRVCGHCRVIVTLYHTGVLKSKR